MAMAPPPDHVKRCPAPTQEAINDIIDRLDAAHEKYKDGCKSSCRTYEVGFYQARNGYAESYWFVRFGGYCLGTCARWETIQAPTLEELSTAVADLLAKVALDETWKERWRRTP
jgi:hypothetical protein